jgi:hypothetical protein
MKITHFFWNTSKRGKLKNCKNHSNFGKKRKKKKTERERERERKQTQHNKYT